MYKTISARNIRVKHYCFILNKIANFDKFLKIITI